MFYTVHTIFEIWCGIYYILTYINGGRGGVGWVERLGNVYCV